MRKDGKIKISYAVAAGVLLGSVSMTSLASPVAGVVGMASTDSATVASNSYSTLSGVSLTLANILSDASAAANNTSDVASNDTTTVEQPQQSEYALSLIHIYSLVVRLPAPITHSSAPSTVSPISLHIY